MYYSLIRIPIKGDNKEKNTFHIWQKLIAFMTKRVTLIIKEKRLKKKKKKKRKEKHIPRLAPWPPPRDRDARCVTLPKYVSFSFPYIIHIHVF